MTISQSTQPSSTATTLEKLGKTDKVYLFVLTVFFTIAILDKNQLFPLIELTLSNLGHAAIYMALAVLLLSAIKATGAETMIASIFEGRKNRMIAVAALVGGLAPFCSCEVIPFIAGLLAIGTPLPPIMAFWLSSPLIDPATLLITAGVLGWKFAVSKAVFAVAIGMLGGYTTSFLMPLGSAGTLQKPSNTVISPTCCSQPQNKAQSCCNTEAPTINNSPKWLFWSDKKRIFIFIHEFKSNGLFLLKWMLFAYTLESLMIHYLPAQLIASVVGGEGVWPVILSALVGVPAYLNSYVAPSLVSGLMHQGMSVGSAMAFIVAGAISSIPAMTAVYALVRKRIFALYLVLGFSGAVLSGFIYSFIG